MSSRRRLLLHIVALGCTLVSSVSAAHAGVAVIANRTAVDARFSLAQDDNQQPRDLHISGGDSLTVPLDFSRRITLHAAGADQVYTVSPDTAYVLAERSGGFALRAIGLTEGLAAPPLVLPAVDWNTLAAKPAVGTTRSAAVVVPVRILVDDDERAARPVWEKRLRGRVDAASQILERDCGVKLHVADVGTWESNNDIQDFPQSLDEFARRVKLNDQRLAIGFTSQYALVRGQTHLGGIHGPLATHLLVREWSQIISEPERLEVLLHELGHFLGAAHSPESDSVMRPILADRRARAVKFRIGFDPLNTLVASLVGAQLRAGARSGISDLDLPVQLQLRPIDAELSRAMPDDTNPRRYLGLIDRGGVERIVQATRAVVAGIEVAAADASPADGESPPALENLAGSMHAAQRLRAAAKFAAQLPADRQRLACLLAVSLTGPARAIVAGHPLARPVCDRVAVGSAVSARSTSADLPTETSGEARFERLLASAGLASLIGPQLAEAAALAETGIADPSSKAVDLADFADRLAGIGLAQRPEPTRAGRSPLAIVHLSEQLSLDDILPKLSAASRPASAVISRDEFDRRYGSALDPRFLALRKQLCIEIKNLPAYRSADAIEGRR